MLNKSMSRSRAVLLVGCLLAGVLSACSPSGSDPHPAANGGYLAQQTVDWALHGNNPAETRYSDLDQINQDTVNDLKVAWFADIESRSLRGVEATPIVIDGVMYVSGPWSVVLALDARTGETLWAYDPEVEGATARKACCDVVNRGVAVADGKVLLGALDGRLIALDQQSGSVVWQTQTTDLEKSYTITGAPRVIGDKVIIGNGGGEYGVRGYVTAYDLETGTQVWRFYTVPGNPEDGFESAAMKMAAETWTGEWWKHGGGGTAWDSFAYDPELDLLYVGTGNGSPWNVSVRSPGGGDNLFLSSIVAVRPDTGEYVWHFQTTPEDQWDYTATQHMILADLEIDGAIRKVIMQAPKNGFFYVIDRETGAFISGQNYVPVSWTTGLDPETGRPDILPEARYSAAETQKDTPFLGMPSPGGGHNWHPMSFNPETGLVYFAAMEMPYGYIALDAEDFSYTDKAWNTGEDYARFSMPEDPEIRAQIRSMMKGYLLAWDPVAQKEVWRHPLATPWNGGTLSTAGGLVFQGNGEGYFNAFDAATGKKMWEQQLSSGVVAAPVTYAIGDEQYVSVAIGWGGVLPLNLGEPLKRGVPPAVNRVVTFKLGGEGELPLETAAAFELDPPESIASAEVISAGRTAYHKSCWMCHGDSGVNNSSVPNLRYSRTLGDPEIFNAFVLGGIAEARGMPNFSDNLTPDDAEVIRAYLVRRANDLKNNPEMP